MRTTFLRRLPLHLILLVGVVFSIFPFYWMVVMATNTTSDIYRYPPKLTFGSELATNIVHVFEKIPFFAAMANTAVVAVATTALVLFFDSLAAFSFAKFDFPGRRVLFGLLLGMFMLPAQLALIPQFVIMVKLGWAGQLQALIVPAAANAFGIFWMRQYISRAVPDELLDAARLDGCGFLRQYWHVALPAIRPGLAFLGIYTFIAAWNDYVWPLIVLVDPDRLTLQVALSQLNRSYGQDYSMIMAGALLAVVPLVVVFLLFARGFIADAVKGAIRG
ncbi:carbohydrate ABC transporter permease [Lentzea nigeriaca]|uniref:carbohydrate ABC transporter permease n=1 Tax=Lentzea nigeriaca TaxID=1128665 RepID=UPI00195C27D8|nr:carbohydrate ABC transporter permease [Lentzea nigeriaca]MBM7857207.1 cellobiose transport system permease protein [Lentzea nigeriaca]